MHHAVVLGEHGKLSKREGGGVDRRACGGDGYPAEAVVNQLGLVASSGPGEVLTSTSWSRGSTPSGSPAARCAWSEPGCDSLAAAHLARLARGELAEAVLPFCPPGTEPARWGRWCPPCAGCTRWSEAADLVPSVVVPPAPRPLPELAQLRATSPSSWTRARRGELVDELRARGVAAARGAAGADRA